MGRRRLGIYNDGSVSLVETADGPRVAPDAADFPFLTFACEVGSKFDSTLLFGRTRATSDLDARLLLPNGAGLVQLPHYESLLRLDQVLRATPGTAVAFWRGLSRVEQEEILAHFYDHAPRYPSISPRELVRFATARIGKKFDLWQAQIAPC